MEGQNEQQTKVTDEMFKEQILHKLNELRKENFLCDTTVRVEGQDFPAHKNVLSATSEVRFDGSHFLVSFVTNKC